MSVAFGVPNSAASQHGGKLFDLPRELRDAIYRYIVKGTYFIGHGSADFGVLFVSKAISDEALAVLYSESTFRILLQFTEEKAKWSSPRRVSQRMMNIELDVTAHVDVPLNSKKSVWKETLRCINRTNTVRRTLRIKCRPCSSDITNPMPEWMYRDLQPLTRFRTVIVELPRDLYFRSENYPRANIFEELENRMEAIAKDLGHAFGPATVTPRYGSGYRWQTRTLTFHPQEHLPKNSRVLRHEKTRIG